MTQSKSDNSEAQGSRTLTMRVNGKDTISLTTYLVFHYSDLFFNNSL